jgi:hypothetical protein
MPGSPPRVWLADMIRGMAALPGADRGELIELFGLRGQAAPRAEPGAVPDRTTGAARPRPDSVPHGQLPRLDMLEPVRRGKPAARGADAAGPGAADAGTSLPAAIAPVRHRPLMTGGQARRALRAAFARPRRTHRIDVARLVDRMAALEPLEPIPVERHDRLSPDAELLLDIGSGMQPFHADRADVVRAARRILGVRLSPKLFKQVPTRPAGAGAGPVWTWRSFQPPARRRAVVFVTDLGLATPLPDGLPAAEYEWAELFADLRRRDVVPVVLSPYRPERASARLRRRAVIVQWDRGLAERAVAQAVRARVQRPR